MRQHQVLAWSGKIQVNIFRCEQRAYGPDVMKVECFKSSTTIEGMHVMNPSEDDADSFYHKCIVHFGVLWTRLNSDPVLLPGNNGKVTSGYSETWTLAWCLDLASQQCPFSWHAHCPEFLIKRWVVKPEHPPHSPDLTPCDFWLFPKRKTTLKDQRFSDICQHSGTCDNHSEQHSRRGLQHCFEHWKQCPPKHAAAPEDHIKGDSSYCDIQFQAFMANKFNKILPG